MPMLFNGLKYLSSTAGLLWLILFWRLAAHGRQISFMNLLLALKFLLLALGSFCCSYFLFQLGFENFFEEEDFSSEVNSYLCKTYLTSYMITYTFVTYRTSVSSSADSSTFAMPKDCWMIVVDFYIE